MQIAVIGPGDGASEAERAAGYRVGRLLAEAGAVVITGGLGGVMAEAARGCRDRGGIAVGVLPGTERGNPYLTVALPTGMGQMRNVLVVRSADGVISVGGSWGTLSEVALAMRTGLPVVALGGWQVSAADGTPQQIEEAATPEEAVQRICAVAGR